jgi:hypothetical protein
MKAKQLAIVLVLLVAVGGFALVLHRQNAASWSNTATSSSGKVLEFPLNEVSHLTIKGSGAELNLVKKDDLWAVRERADYPANFEMIGGLIRKIWELRPVQDVKIGPSQFARLQLVEPSSDGNSGTLVDLKDARDKRLALLLLGKKHLRDSRQPFGRGEGIPVGRYVMANNDSKRVFLISETFDEVDPKPERWLSRDFIQIEKPKSIAVAGATAEMNWKLARDNPSAPWKLLDAKPGEELDNAKASAVENNFANPTFTDVLDPDAKLAETSLDKPSTAIFETFDDFVYELKIGKLMGENYPVLVSVTAKLPKERTPGKDEKPEDKARLDQEFQARQKQLTDKLAKEQKLQKRPYLISRTSVDQLLKDRSALMAEKKPSPSPTAATSPPGKKGASPPKPPR